MADLAHILKLIHPQGVKEVPKCIKLHFRDIQKIGRVDPVYHLVEEMSLNKNMLRSLDGIEQFQCLKVLRVNSNSIREWA